MPRTGPYMFGDLLEQLPGLTFKGEILNPGNSLGIAKGVSQQTVARHFRQSLGAASSHTVVAKVMVEHLLCHKVTLSDLCEAQEELAFIFLYRRNGLAQYASFEQAKKDGIWMGAATDRQPSSIELDPRMMINWLERNLCNMNTAYDEARSISDSCLTVAYEDIVDPKNQVFRNQVLPLLKLQRRAACPKARTPKKGSKALKDRVNNFDQVIKELGGEPRIEFNGNELSVRLEKTMADNKNK